MAIVAEDKLVIAVCNAGGIGFLPIRRITKEQLREQIRRVKAAIGNKPFVCSMSPIMTGAKDIIKIWIEGKVPVWG